MIFVGLLEEYQGVDLLLESMSIVCKEIKNVQLIIVGYPNEEKYKVLTSKLAYTVKKPYLCKQIATGADTCRRT